MQVTDHLGRSVELTQYPPQRIVSLCPSQTELLFALGAGHTVVGATQWCIHPSPEIDSVVKVGGTKKVNYKKLEALKPDLILCEKEENTPDMVNTLLQNFPVFITNVESVTDACRMIEDIGLLVNRKPEAQQLMKTILAGFKSLPRPARAYRTAYLIWREPWMAAGPTTYINDVLSHCGLTNVFTNEGDAYPHRYPALGLEELKERETELVLLSSEPYAFTDEHITEVQRELPNAKIILVDGEMFSWYGSRMQHAVSYLNHFVRAL